MEISYPSVFEVFILANAAGTNFITENAAKTIQIKFSQFIGSISNRIASLLLNLDSSDVITSYDIISILNENISSGDYCTGYYYLDNHELLDNNIDKLTIRSNRFLTTQDRFNGSLRKNIDRSVKMLYQLKNQRDNYPVLKITKNASALLQRYVERKLTEYIRTLMRISESNVITAKLINSSLGSIKIHDDRIHAKMKNFDFYQQICEYIDFNHKGKRINFETVEEINTILCVSISAVLNVHNDLFDRYKKHNNLMFASINIVKFASSERNLTSPDIWNDDFINNMMLLFGFIGNDHDDYRISKSSIIMMKCFLEDILEKVINNCCTIVGTGSNGKTITFDYCKLITGNKHHFGVSKNIPILSEFFNRIGYYNYKKQINSFERPIQQNNIEMLFTPSTYDLLDSEYPLDDFIIEDEQDREVDQPIIDSKVDFNKYKAITSKIISGCRFIGNDYIRVSLKPIIEDEIDEGYNEINEEDETIQTVDEESKSHVAVGCSNRSDVIIEYKPTVPKPSTIILSDNPTIRYTDMAIISDVNKTLIDTINSLTLKKKQNQTQIDLKDGTLTSTLKIPESEKSSIKMPETSIFDKIVPGNLLGKHGKNNGVNGNAYGLVSQKDLSKEIPVIIPIEDQGQFEKLKESSIKQPVGLFGGPAVQPLLGLFGGPAVQPLVGLFEAPAFQHSLDQPSLSLFGGPSVQIPQQQSVKPPTSLFGGPAAAQPSLVQPSLVQIPQQQSVKPPTSLFGGPAAVQPSLGLFGGQSVQIPQQQSVKPTTSLFGGPAAAQPSLVQPSLVQPSIQIPQQPLSLFGQPQSQFTGNPSNSLFGPPPKKF